MTQATNSNVNALVREIVSIPEPEQAEYIKMMRHALMGLRLTERVHTVQPPAERPGA